MIAIRVEATVVSYETQYRATTFCSTRRAESNDHGWRNGIEACHGRTIDSMKSVLFSLPLSASHHLSRLSAPCLLPVSVEEVLELAEY
jgi:hypothetical protein